MIQYFLAVVIILSGQPPSQQQYGPFHNLLACEAAASQVTIAALEAHHDAQVGTACLRQKDLAFKWRESK